jgi:DNA-binding NtrC family response regulator
MALRVEVFGRTAWRARPVLREALLGLSWESCEETVPDALVRHARSRDADLIIIGGEDDLELVRAVRDADPTCAVIVFTTDASQQFAIDALRAGVTDLLGDDASRAAIDGALLRVAGSRERHDGADVPASLIGGARLVGRSRAVEEMRLAIRQVAQSDSNVLITGETGTGKELIAELIHRNSARARKPLVCINCAAIPDSLVESELFGYERGAFTGAHATTAGKLEAANGGTVFFDEIGEMTPYAQAKILRAIETKQIQRLGSHRSIPVNVRVVSATHRDLDTLAMEEGFRKDLYFRINVGRIHLPPLRDRRADIPRLIDHYVAELNRTFSAEVVGFESATLEHLVRYDWPGNVRELRNVLESVFVSRPAPRIIFSDLPQWLRNRLQAIDPTKLMGEQDRILDALLATNWNKSLAAQKLHWSRMTLYRKLAKYGLDERGV